MDARDIRAASRNLLKGKLSLAIAVSLVLGGCLMLVFFFLDFALYLFGWVDPETGETIAEVPDESFFYLLLFYFGLLLVHLFLVQPLKTGAARFFFALASGATPSVSTLFYAFSSAHYGRTLVLNTLLTLRKAGWYFLFGMPGFLLSGLSAEFSNDTAASLASGGGVLLFAAGLALAAIVNLRYFAVRYVFAASDTVKARLALKTGTNVMKGNKSEAFVLKFSFLGWFLLTVPTVGISLIYVVPYYLTSLGMFAKEKVDTFLFQTA